VRTATDCTYRAEECRRLAKLAVKTEDFGHFLEMAETWEWLAKQRQVTEHAADEHAVDEHVVDEQAADEHVVDEQLADILALADAIANGRHNKGRLINVP
jgi:hypothetical protein